MVFSHIDIIAVNAVEDSFHMNRLAFNVEGNFDLPQIELPTHAGSVQHAIFAPPRHRDGVQTLHEGLQVQLI